jgi:HEAT repeat protein
MMPPVDARRDEVAEVLDTYLAEKNYSARSSALRAVQTWGTKRNVPALIPLLRPSEDDSVRRRAMDILVRIGDERPARAFAELVKNPADRERAARALRAIGRGAEAAVLALLADEDPEVRAEACNVLAEIGGPQSAAALAEQLQKEADPGAKSAAKKALEKLQKKP